MRKVLHVISADKAFVVVVFSLDVVIDIDNIITVGGFVDSFATVCSCSFSGSSGTDYVTVHVDLWAGFEVHVVHVVHVIHVDLHWVEGSTGQGEQP